MACVSVLRCSPPSRDGIFAVEAGWSDLLGANRSLLQGPRLEPFHGRTVRQMPHDGPDRAM